MRADATGLVAITLLMVLAVPLTAGPVLAMIAMPDIAFTVEGAATIFVVGQVVGRVGTWLMGRVGRA